MSPWKVSRDADLLASAHRMAHAEYEHSPIVCGIDVYHAEAEAWGAKVMPAAGGKTPALGEPPLREPGEIAGLRTLDAQKDGRLPLLLNAAAFVAKAIPEAEVQVPLAGPVSIAMGLLGFEAVLLEFAEESEAMREGIEILARHQEQLCRQLLALGFRPAIYESGAAPPLVSPSLFRSLVAPALRTVLAPGVEAGSRFTCIIGGNIAGVAAHLFNAGPGMVICPAETDQQAFMEAAAAYPEVTVRVNMPANLLGSGDRSALFEGIDRLLPLALNHPRGLLGTGVVPYDCDPELVCAARLHAAEAASRRL